MRFGDLIKKYRVDKHLTQKSLAEILGVSASAVNKWEKNSTIPDVSMLMPITRALNVELDELMTSLDFKYGQTEVDRTIHHDEYMYRLMETIADGFFLVVHSVEGNKIAYSSEKCQKLLGAVGTFELTEEQLEELFTAGEITCHVRKADDRDPVHILQIKKIEDYKDSSKFFALIRNLTQHCADRYAAMRETALRQAMLSDCVLSVAFDITTNQRIFFDYDRSAPVIEDVNTFREFMLVLARRMHKYDMTDIMADTGYIIAPESISPCGSREQFVCRMLSHKEDEKGYLWYRFVYSYFRDSKTGHTLLYIICYPIYSYEKKMLKATTYASTDYLTGLPNRYMVERYCEQNHQDDSLKGELNAVVLIEIDNFEQLWTRHTLEEQDRVIHYMADSMKPYLEENMMASRFSDGGFLLIIHRLGSIEHLEALLRNLSDSMRLIQDDGKGYAVSIGAAICRHDPAQGYRCSFEDARSALATARQNGSNQITLLEHNRIRSLTKQEMQTQKVGKSKKVSIITFGYFDVFIENQPIPFQNQKAKELLAILVDRRGGFVTADEAIAFLWEDEPISDKVRYRYRRAAMEMNRILKQYGIEDIVETTGRKRRIIPEKVECDLYMYLSGEGKDNLFNGKYMSNYSWGENTQAELMWNDRRHHVPDALMHASMN